MREIILSIERELRRYKKLADGAFAQVGDEQLAQTIGEDGNSIAILVWHLSGNFKSRFTDFLTTDGEKPWRQRESEFDSRQVRHEELLAKWEDGWTTLFDAVGQLTDADLNKRVAIRGESLSVSDALLRALAHTSYHVGQIVLLGKSFRGAEWQTLTIPRSRKLT